MTERPQADGHDAPIQSEHDDLLNGIGVARAIHRVIATTPAAWSTRVGLYGPWGSGKTSVLNLLRSLEESSGSLVVSFSAWSAAGDGSVISQFYGVLAKKLLALDLQMPTKQRAKALIAKVTRVPLVGSALRIGAEHVVPVPPAVTKAAIDGLARLASSASTWARISPEDLQALVTLLRGRRVVVFIDDLDRADPKVVPKTLLALRELLDWPGFAFVLAFDKKAVASALYDYSAAFGEDAQGFLEKVIDVPFELTEAEAEQRRRFADTVFKACCDVMPSQTIDALMPVLPPHPRRVKLIARMMGSLRPALLRHASDEIDWVALGLYLVVKEANPAVADWVVNAVTSQQSEWLLWLRDKKEREAKLADARKLILGMFSTPKSVADAERATEAALRLLAHWDMTPDEAVRYQVGLVYREPIFTLKEFHELLNDFTASDDFALVTQSIAGRARAHRVAEVDAAIECLARGLGSYKAALDLMADSETNVEWRSAYGAAARSLLFLERWWSQPTGDALAAAAARGPIVVALVGAVGRWGTWRRTAEEVELRERERKLAWRALDLCDDAELVYAETDPFWGGRAPSEDWAKTWRKEVRDFLAPRVVAVLCDKFARPDGLVEVANGSDKLGPWLVENSMSPLYTEPSLTGQLLAVLESAQGASESVRVALAKNARLYLLQVLFQTRDASWGGLDDARAIHRACPLLLPAAWRAVAAVPVPFRMRTSIRRLRDDLIGIGVEAGDLPEPTWLRDEDATTEKPPSPAPTESR